MNNSLNSTEINLTQSVLLAHASDLAYATTGLVQMWTRRQGLGEAVVFDHGRTQGYYAHHGDTALLAFRGTNDLGQAIRDLRFMPMGHTWGRIHAGFRAHLNDITGELEAFHQTTQHLEHVWITGHSLGGAIAVLAAAWLKEHKGRSARVMTFAQPRVGLETFSKRFAQELPGCLIRFINRDDLIPRLPAGYSHPPLPKHITDDGLQFADRPPLLSEEELPAMSETEYEALIQKIDNLPPGALQESEVELQGAIIDRIPWFANHRMRHYISSLESLLAEGTVL